jgi:hypothetical protein
MKAVERWQFIPLAAYSSVPILLSHEISGELTGEWGQENEVLRQQS